MIDLSIDLPFDLSVDRYDPLTRCKVAYIEFAIKAGLCIVAAGLIGPVAVLAQTGTPPAVMDAPPAVDLPQATGTSLTFEIKGFDLKGDVPVPRAEIDRILAPFVGPGATIDTLQKATAALEAAFKAQGLALHRVALPPQEVGQTVTLNVVKFVIGKVILDGNTLYSQTNIRTSVPELREGQSPNFGIMAIQTAIANENPGKQIQVSLKESEEADKIDAVILVKEAPAWNLSAGLSNTGSDSTGTDRFSLVGGYSNVADRDHQFSGAYTTSLQRIRDVRQIGLNYRIPVYARGSVIGLSYTNSDVVGSFGTFSSTGAGQTLGVNYNHYLQPNGGQRGNLTLGIDEKRFRATQINGVVAPGQQDRSSRPVTLGYSSRTEADSVLWGYNVELAMNWSGGSGNDLAAYQSEDPRVTSVDWRVVRGGGNYLAATPSGWLWGVRGQWQYGATALISGEQFGLGGSTSVRGTGERPISGDSGWFASLEVTTPYLLPGLRTVGFVEGGRLFSHDTWLNANKPAADHLLGAGLGLRYALGAYALTLDWARILKGSVLNVAGQSLPQTGDQQFHLNLTYRF